MILSIVERPRNPWHLLMRAQRHVWDSKDWDWLTKIAAQQLLWELSIAVCVDRCNCLNIE